MPAIRIDMRVYSHVRSFLSYFPLIFPLFRHAPPPPVGDIESGDSFRCDLCYYDMFILYSMYNYIAFVLCICFVHIFLLYV